MAADNGTNGNNGSIHSELEKKKIGEKIGEKIGKN